MISESWNVERFSFNLSSFIITEDQNRYKTLLLLSLLSYILGLRLGLILIDFCPFTHSKKKKKHTKIRPRTLRDIVNEISDIRSFIIFNNKKQNYTPKKDPTLFTSLVNISPSNTAGLNTLLLTSF